MKNILFYFLIVQIINISIQVVPLWNFESSAFDLFYEENTHHYNVVERKLYDVTIRLEREILKENENITVKNTLYLNNVNYGITEYDDVESFYQNNKGHYLICPKGKFHMYIYDNITKEHRIEKPQNFKEKGDWDFMCFYQWRHKTMFIAYLGDNYDFYQYNFEEETFKNLTQFNHGLFAFKWKTEGYTKDSDEKIQMFAITRYWGAYYVNNYLVNATKEGGIEHNELKYRHLSEGIKSNFIASFGKDNNFYFFWINYNSSNVFDFEIGGYSGYDKITTDNFPYIIIEKSTNSPLVFFEKMTIVDLKFIFAMSFAYYTLKDDKGKYYYGIIDAQRKRVIFHTDVEIKKFIPYSDNAMLAITQKSAYKICVSRNENDCQVCDSSQFMLDSSKYNFCGTNCNSKYILMPNNICTDTCDESIFIIKDNICGLCKDYGDGNEYKFYNIPGCLNRKPENSVYLNEDLKIISCANNYKYENGNCVENCSYNYFWNDKICQKCDDNCKTCELNDNNCTSCIDGKYVDKTTGIHICKNCNDNCETCELRGDKCKTCSQNSTFKYLFNSSCYENCPNNTELNETTNICKEIKEDNKEDNKEDKNNKKNSSDSILLSIFTIITAGLLILTLFCFFRRYCFLNKNPSGNLLNEIDKELIEN